MMIFFLYFGTLIYENSPIFSIPKKKTDATDDYQA